jgi:hypothetical protein
LFVLSPLLLPANIWYAAALNQMPMQIALLLAVRSHLRYLRGGRPRDAVLTSAWIVFGLAFYEKTLVVVPLLVAVTVLWFATGRPLHRLRTVAGEYWRTWSLQAGVVGCYLAFYLNHGKNDFAGKGSSADRLHVGHNLLLKTIVPGLLGGPWNYSPIGTVTSIAAPPGVPQWVALFTLVGVVLVSVLLVRSAWRAWALLGGWIVLDMTLVLYGRIGATLGLEPRDVTDLSLVGALCTGLAFLPLPGSYVVPDRPPTRRWAVAVRDLARPVVPQLGAALVGAVAIGSLISNSSLVGIWQDNPGKAFIANARRDIAGLPPGTPLVDTDVPDSVVSRLAILDGKSEGLPSLLFRPLPHRPPQLTAAPALAILDAKGHVQSARVGVVDSVPAVPGPTPQCGWAIGTSPVDVPLAHDLADGTWAVQINYIATATVQGTVTAGTTTRAVTFAFGHADLFLAASGRLSNIRISVAGTGGTLCVDTIGAGFPSPATGAGS